MKIFAYLTALSLVMGCGGGGGGGGGGAGVGEPSQSGTIQISQDDQFVFSVNKIDSDEANTRFDRLSDVNGSLSIINVVNDANVVVDEITVGKDPRSVSVNQNRTRAFVTNGQDGTVSVIDLDALAVIATVTVGSEPRGTALTPNGTKLYVLNYGDGTISVINTANNTVIRTIDLIFFGNQQDPFILDNPYSIMITDDDDGDDDDETIFVADFFARGIEDLGVDEREGLNDGKEGRVAVLDTDTDTITTVIQISPVADGVFRGSFFNQLHQIVFRNGTTRMYIPTIAASPETPTQFDANVQAMVAVLEVGSNTEVVNEHFNVNDKLSLEIEPTAPFDPTNTFRLDRAFSGDTVSMAINAEKVLFVSRSGGYITRGFFIGDEVEFENPAIRIPVGNMPTGVVMNSEGTRAYVNAEVSAITTAINLDDNSVIDNINNATLPPVGTPEHEILIGKLAFYTGMGLPANDLLGEDIRNFDTHTFRSIASNSNWSSCGSCHPDGLSDGVTWIFGTGPRQTIPLDGSFDFNDPDNDRRALNWNAIRGSVTDFNNNSRNIQGGFGFTPDAQRAINDNQDPDNVVDAIEVFDYGPDEETDIPNIADRGTPRQAGASDALNAMTTFIQKGVRTFKRSTEVDAAAAARGRTAFQAFCVDCHSGPKWTTSQILWDIPLFNIVGGQLDNDVNVIISDPNFRSTLTFDDGGGEVDIINADFETFDLNNPIENNAAGEPSLAGNVSFNPPSLLGVRHTAPYGHHGRGARLEDVFLSIGEEGLGHFDFGAGRQIPDILEFLKTIDEDEPPFVIIRRRK